MCVESGDLGFLFGGKYGPARLFSGCLFLVFPLKYIQGPKIITFSYLGFSGLMVIFLGAHTIFVFWAQGLGAGFGSFMGAHIWAQLRP